MAKIFGNIFLMFWIVAYGLIITYICYLRLSFHVSHTHTHTHTYTVCFWLDSENHEYRTNKIESSPAPPT